MSYKQWKTWLSTLPWSVKWFVLLVLFRPLIDLVYFLKEISPILSPVYIVGMLTPFIVLLSFLSNRFPNKYPSWITDLYFSAWSIFVIVNLFFLISINFTLDAIGNAVKYATPVFLFFYCRAIINSKLNLIGILQTIMYSAYLPAAILIYEILFGAINAEYLTDSRGGGARIQGGFADIMNYAIYISAALLIRGYFFIRNKRQERRILREKFWLGVVVLFCFIGLVGIKQTASWSVALFLTLLFVLFNLGSRKGIIITIMLIPLLIIVGQITYTSRIQPLVEKEVKVLEGESNVDKSFNGRMGRWKRYFNIWLEMPVVTNLIGSPMSGRREVMVMTGGGIHSDFVRILFLTGIIGLFFYLSFFLNLLKKTRYMKSPEKFLILGGLGIMLLYSVSTSPTLYSPFLYFIMPIFAYASLPKTILKLNG